MFFCYQKRCKVRYYFLFRNTFAKKNRQITLILTSLNINHPFFGRLIKT